MMTETIIAIAVGCDNSLMLCGMGYKEGCRDKYQLRNSKEKGFISGKLFSSCQMILISIMRKQYDEAKENI